MKKHSAWLFITASLTLTLLIFSSLIGRIFFVSPVYNPNLFEFKDTINTLIIGASHSATSIDPDHIEGAISVALSGEPLFFTYYKAKVLLSNNPHIKDVLIAISPIHVAQYSDKNVFQGNSKSQNKAMNYYFLIDDFSDPLINQFSSGNILGYLKFHWGLPLNYMSDLRVALNYHRNTIDYSAYPFFGGVERIEGNHTEKDRITEKVKYYFYDENGKANASDFGAEVTRRIASLTEQFDIKLTIISTPMHPYFIQQIPENIQQKYDETIKSVLQHYPNVRFIDSSAFPISEDQFLDGDHLNAQGLEKYSRNIIKEHIKSTSYLVD
ncbi:MAG: SGNH/GDSL hydrolase family protein [Flavobacteriales bacterium]|nr:SGNH/GDSL hydrolase family protein [Flavobacteriales bacterium]